MIQYSQTYDEMPTRISGNTKPGVAIAKKAIRGSVSRRR